MKKLCVVVLISALVILFPLALASPAEEMTAEGRVELGGSFGFTYSSYEGGSIAEISVMPTVGCFVKPKLELEPTLLFEHTSTDPDNAEGASGTAIGGILNVLYHFESANHTDSHKLVPFVFAGAGFVFYSGDLYPDDAEPAMVLPNAGGGIKFFITNSAVIRGEAFWEHVTNQGGLEDNDADHFGIRAGVSIFVK